jgi:predicted transcriptional regulator
MKLQQIISIVDGQVLVDAGVDQEISCAAASDLMSDVLAFAEPYSILLTGLCNPQVVRTAEMADIAAIIFVRGKVPEAETIALAKEKGITQVVTKAPMFEVCGRLYQAGLKSCDVSCRITAPKGPPNPPEKPNHSPTL